MGGGRRTGRGGVGLGNQDGCECSSEVFVKIQKKLGGGSGLFWGGGVVRVDANEKSEVIVKMRVKLL